MRFLKKYLAKRRELAKFRQSSTEEVFTYIHESNKWGDTQSRSGKGSNLDKTERIRSELPQLLEEIQVRSLLDIPCGDYFWMKEVTLPVESYIGADIVAELIEENVRNYSNDQRSFQKLNLLEDPLPQVDAIFCRDCLVHFSYADIARAIDNVKASGATWLLTTNFPDQKRNS
ncbi:MAG: class I SAM-dependent methyltransferase, partial [Pseudomonadales bacterium]